MAAESRQFRERVQRILALHLFLGFLQFLFAFKSLCSELLKHEFPSSFLLLLQEILSVLLVRFVEFFLGFFLLLGELLPLSIQSFLSLGLDIYLAFIF